MGLTLPSDIDDKSCLNKSWPEERSLY